MNTINTTISLPPGLLPANTVREILRLVFDEFRWFYPTRYGFGTRRPLEPDRPQIEQILDLYTDLRAVTVLAPTDHDSLLIAPTDLNEIYPHVGILSWTTSTRSARSSTWRVSHEVQIKRLMAIVGSPLAIAAIDDDLHRKMERLVARDFGSELVSTVRDYSEGLAGLYWRSFFGPPFVRMFGERLQSLPSEYRRDLGDGIVLVEPYPLPGNAETDEGKRRERELIAHLGPECFYDHERHTLPTRRPDLPCR